MRDVPSPPQASAAPPPMGVIIRTGTSEKSFLVSQLVMCALDVGEASAMASVPKRRAAETSMTGGMGLGALTEGDMAELGKLTVAITRHRSFGSAPNRNSSSRASFERDRETTNSTSIASPSTSERAAESQPPETSEAFTLPSAPPAAAGSSAGASSSEVLGLARVASGVAATRISRQESSPSEARRSCNNVERHVTVCNGMQ